MPNSISSGSATRMFEQSFAGLGQRQRAEANAEIQKDSDFVRNGTKAASAPQESVDGENFKILVSPSKLPPICAFADEANHDVVKIAKDLEGPPSETMANSVSPSGVDAVSMQEPVSAAVSPPMTDLSVLASISFP